MEVFEEMRVICVSGGKCEHYIYEKEFDVDDFDSGRCPECGGKIAPAWLKECRLPGEEKLRTELRELYERKKKLDAEERGMQERVE